MNQSAIALRGLTKRFGAVTAVDGVSLEIAPGEFFSLLGPSGCGKTTLLRTIAGFEEPDEGGLAIDGREMRGIPPQQRPVNTVFQNYALFPHLSVYDNVAFSLRMRHRGRAEIDRTVGELLEMLHVGELRNRRPGEISGGQKQRVALARALAAKPKVLLLDEPLAAVDAQRRAQVQQDLKALQRRSQTTFLYITHDQDEALSLSDRLAVMSGGRIAQLGTPRDVYERPRTRFVASFVGRCNLISGSAAAPGATSMGTSLGTLHLEEAAPAQGSLCLGIRAERLRLGGQAGATNTMTAKVAGASYTGSLTEYTLQVGAELLRAAESGGPPRAEGSEVLVTLPPDALFFVAE
jgi:spermidine/putrescine transport system ATP-binding protein